MEIRIFSNYHGERLRLMRQKDSKPFGRISILILSTLIHIIMINNKMKKNDETISIAKGICIILVVIGHCTPLGAANNFMYQFHVALFFFTAGYFFSDKKVARPFEFIKRRIIGLYVPYLKYALFFLLIHNILVSLHIMSDYYDISSWLYRLYLITTHFSGHDEMLGGFWFIKELFVVSVLYLFLRNYIAKSSKQIIEVLFILLFVAIVMSHFEIEIPWLQFSHRTVVGLFLFGLGEVACRLNISNLYDTKMALLAMPLMIVSAICGRFYFESSNTNIIVFLVLAVVGIYCCLSLSKYIEYRGGVVS